jgi:hypothetical protein
VRVAALAVILAWAYGFTYWAANYNNRDPTPIDGTWRVVSGPVTSSGPAWRQVFFERNRAHWVTFRAADGTDALHHFEVDKDGVVRIWDKWLAKGDLLMQGRVTNDRIELTFVTTPNGAPLVLERGH